MAHPFRRKAAADMIGDTRPSWHLHRYLQGSANLFEENRLLKVAIAGLFGITAVLGTLIYTSNQNTRTVVVPFGADGDLYVTGNKPSEVTFVRSHSTSSDWPAPIQPIRPTASSRNCCVSSTPVRTTACATASTAARRARNNPTLSIATYIRSDQPVTWSGSEILVPVEKVRVIGGVIRKFRGNLRIRYALENGRFWLTALQEENFSAEVR
jgi:conjugal transfer pilus assembly protein TraE